MASRWSKISKSLNFYPKLFAKSSSTFNQNCKLTSTLKEYCAKPMKI